MALSLMPVLQLRRKIVNWENDLSNNLNDEVLTASSTHKPGTMGEFRVITRRSNQLLIPDCGHKALLARLTNLSSSFWDDCRLPQPRFFDFFPA